MEETKKFYSSSRKFSDEISAIYQMIIEYRTDANAADEKKEERWFETLVAKATTVVLIILGSFMGALYFLPHNTWGDTNEKRKYWVKSFILPLPVICLFYVNLLPTAP